jgi:hypothetical protein
MEGYREIRMAMSPLPAPFHFIPSLIRNRSISQIDWVSNILITLFALSLQEDDICRLDATPADELIRRLRVSKRFREHFWAFTSNAIMNTSLEACSAGALMRVYRRLIGQRGYRIGLPTRGLGELFAPAARNLIIGRGGRIEIGAPVRQICVNNQRVEGVHLGDGRFFRSNRVISALPPHDLLACADGPITDAYPAIKTVATFEPCPYVSVFLWLDRRIGVRSFWARAYSRSDLNCDFYDLANIYDGWQDRPSLIASNIIDARRLDSLSDDDIVIRSLCELRENIRSAQDAQVLHSAVHRIPMAIPLPNVRAEQLRPDPATPVSGLFLAGDWIRTALPASIESACYSGWRAAELVLADVGRPEKFAVDSPELDTMARLLGNTVSGILRLQRTVLGPNRARRKPEPASWSKR